MPKTQTKIYTIDFATKKKKQAEDMCLWCKDNYFVYNYDENNTFGCVYVSVIFSSAINADHKPIILKRYLEGKKYKFSYDVIKD